MIDLYQYFIFQVLKLGLEIPKDIVISTLFFLLRAVKIDYFMNLRFPKHLMDVSEYLLH